MVTAYLLFAPISAWADSAKSMMEPNQITWDHIFGISTVIIAITAVVFSYWQIKMSQKHNRLSVTPHLDISYGGETASVGLCFELENNGIGPAFIKSYAIIINEVTYQIKTIADVVEVFKKLGINRDYIVLSHFEEGAGLKVGHSEPILYLNKKYRNSDGVNKEFMKAAMKIGFEIEYQSIYREKFSFKKLSFTSPDRMK